MTTRMVKFYLPFYIQPYFKWFDLWVGVYIDREMHQAYIQPLPMLGLKVGYWRAGYWFKAAFANKRCKDCNAPIWIDCECIPF